MTIVFPSTKTTKDDIRNAIGVTATFVFGGVEEACPDCSVSGYLDLANQTSLNSFCPICSGAYYIVHEVASGIMAHVRWGYGDQSDHGIAGEILAGICTVTIASDSITNISNIKEVRVDGKKLEVKSHIYRGAHSRDRIRFTCQEFGVE